MRSLDLSWLLCLVVADVVLRTAATPTTSHDAAITVNVTITTVQSGKMVIGSKFWLKAMFKDMGSVSRSNHEAYAAQHQGYRSVTITKPLQRKRRRVWDKIMVVKQLIEQDSLSANADQAALPGSAAHINSGDFEHAAQQQHRPGVPAAPTTQQQQQHWIWALDADAFIMNMHHSLDKLIKAATQQHKAAHQSLQRAIPPAVVNKTFAEQTPSPELLLIYTADCNGLNAGSFLVKSCPAGLRIMSQVWDAYDSQDKLAQELIHGKSYNEQGALQWLLKTDPSFAASSQQVDMALLNSYYASSCGHNYVPGDFVLRLVNTQKFSWPE